MRYTIATSSYNERRYGRPWIAEVNGKEFIWGTFEGRNGEAGRLVIDCKPGTLVAQGQKDIRKGRGGVDMYRLAMPHGALWSGGLETEAHARDWARKGWEKYAQFRMEDANSPNEVRIAAAKMLGVRDPFSTAAAELFGLELPLSPAEQISVSLEAFGL